MRKQFVSSGTAAHVDAQANAQEGLELLAKLLRLLQSWGAVGGNEIQRLQRLLVEVRWLRLDHLDRHDTERPAVDLGTILLLLDDFRGHPVWCADHGGTLAL